MKKIICFILLFSSVICLPQTNISASTKEELTLNSSLEDDTTTDSNIEVTNMLYDNNYYDMSIRDYQSDNDFINKIIKAFWELWDLVKDEWFGGGSE